MKKTLLLLLTLTAFFCKKNLACDCLFIGSFCETLIYQNDGQIYDYLSIHHIKITAKQTDGVQIEIMETFHGNNLQGQEASIVHGDGGNCQIFTDTFSVGEQYIVATNIYEGDWWVSECGVSFLKIEDGIVRGQVTPSLSQISLSEFPSIADCGSWNITPATEPKPELEITVSPTLAQDWLNIQTSSLSNTDLELSVFDAAGRLVHRATQKGFNSQNDVALNIQNWSTGIYFIKIATPRLQKVVKIVKR